jgi:hypothetical protein
MAQAATKLHKNLILIEVADRLLLDDLFADERAAQYLLNRLSERVAVVAPGQFDALMARLRKLGHTPKVIE